MNTKFEPASPQRRADLVRERRAMSASLWRQRLLLPIAGLLLLIGLLAAAWLISEDQRRSAGDRREVSEEEIRLLRAEVDERMKNFETLAGKKNKLADEDLAELEQAVAAQERIVEAVGLVAAETSRSENLRARLHVYRAERVREASLAAEKAAETALQEGRRTDAIESLRLALRHEAEIAEKWVLSNLDDRGRVSRLDIRLRRLEALPLWEEGRRLEREAEAAAAKGDFGRADELLAEAVTAEQRFVLGYRDVLKTEHDRVDRLLKLAETFRSQAAKAEIEKMAREAELAEKGRQWDRAATLWSSAGKAAGDLLRAYPGSEHADDRLPLAYARREALARVMPDVERFRDVMAQIRELLRTGDTSQAVALAAAAAAQLEVVTRKFPEALAEQDPDRRALAVIQERGTSLAVVREAFVNQLVPLPAHPGRRILRTEVTQALYQAVMGANPSAKRDPVLPVESLDYGQAEEFARRLGWLTGLPVRLPLPEELNAAHQPEGRSIPAAEGWTLDTSEGKVRPVGTSRANPAGIHDLLGNVAEWSLATDAAPTAPVVGGDAQALPEGANLPIIRVGRTETSRLRGFRVVVAPASR